MQKFDIFQRLATSGRINSAMTIDRMKLLPNDHLRVVYFSFLVTFAICYRPSVCRLSSLTFVRPTQAVQIFGNISMALVTLAIY